MLVAYRFRKLVFALLPTMLVGVAAGWPPGLLAQGLRERGGFSASSSGTAAIAIPQREQFPLLAQVAQLAKSAAAYSGALQQASQPMRETFTRLERAVRIGNRLNLTTTQGYIDELTTLIPLIERYGSPEDTTAMLNFLKRFRQHYRALALTAEETARGADRDNLRRYRAANAQVAPPGEPNRRVLFFGDSITDGWKLAEYFPGKDYVNRGISGQITGEMLGRMQADVIAHRPAALLILAGTNDLSRGVPMETIQDNFLSITQLASFHKIKVIVASILPVSDYHAAGDPELGRTAARPPLKIRQLNQWLAKLCHDQGYTYLNYADQMADSKGLLRADLAEDGLHPNEAGYKIMAPLAQAAIDKTLAGQ